MEVRLFVQSYLARLGEDVDHLAANLRANPPEGPPLADLVEARRARGANPPSPSVEAASTYLFWEEDPRALRQVALAGWIGGGELLLISRHPRRWQDLAGSERVRVLQLGGKVPHGTAQVLSDPTPSSLTSPVQDFLARAGEKALLAFNSLDYFATISEPTTLLKLVQWLGDQVRDRRAILLVSSDPSTLEPRPRRLLEREFDLVTPA